MKLCDRCYSMLEESALVCQECGATMESASAPQAADAVAYPEIARANLKRMKGEYAEAEQICLAVLKQFPNNLSAHLLLGDVAWDRGDARQAVQWYDMAVDLAPESASTRAKLDRARALVAKEEIRAGLAGLEGEPSRAGFIWTTLLVIAAIVIVGVFAFRAGGERGRREASDLDKYVEPISIGGEAPRVDQQPEEGSSQPPEPPAAQVQPLQSMAETRILEAVRTGLGAEAARVAACHFDPRTGDAALSVLFGDGGDGDLILLARAGAAAIESNLGVSRVVLKLIATDGRLVMAGTLTADSLRGAAGQPSTVEWANSILRDISRE